MPQEHYVMTLQSFWNGEPREAVTADGIIETDGQTAQQTFNVVHSLAHTLWRQRWGSGGGFGASTMGEPVVLFYQRTPNNLEQ